MQPMQHSTQPMLVVPICDRPSERTQRAHPNNRTLILTWSYDVRMLLLSNCVSMLVGSCNSAASAAACSATLLHAALPDSRPPSGCIDGCTPTRKRCVAAPNAERDEAVCKASDVESSEIAVRVSSLRVESRTSRPPSGTSAYLVLALIEV